ncbi:MAG TPA: hypothetical protein VGC79_32075 [Polyangiaceae bacterium]
MAIGLLSSTLGCSDAGSDAIKHESGPLYVVSTRVTSTEAESLGYLATVTALDGGKFETKNAIETSVGSVQADRERGYLYHASNREPTITRWKLLADGTFEPSATLSFVNLGYESVGAACEAPFFAHDRAYFAQGGELVVWNPDAMKIVDHVSLDVKDEGGLRAWLTLYQRKDRLFVSAYWEGDFAADYSVFGDHASLLEIDPATNRVVKRTDEPRCNQLDTVTAAPDGTAYFSSNAYDAPMRAMLGEGHGVDPCALRILPKDKGFDDSYELDLSTLVGGRQAGDFAIVDHETALLRVWHPELVDAVREDKSNWQDVLGENGHLWWSWKLGEAEAKQIPDQAPGAYGGEWFSVDDQRLFLQAEGDFSSSTLLTFYGERLTPAISGPGYIFGIARVR